MNRKSRILISLLMLGIALPLLAGDKKKKKESEQPKVVDSGSFGVFVSGRRVATETFTIKQMSDMSVTTSDIKLEGSNESQHAELQLTPHGDLIKYEWKESGGQEKGETTVQPSDQFLMQRIKAGDKYTEHPYLMPATSVILDDYFFSQRELLLWKYLGSSCIPKEGEQGCALQKTQYGFVVPRQRSSGMATVEYRGKEAAEIHGAVKELNKFTLSSEFGDWILYLDKDNKLVRVIVVGEGTEVIRD